MNEEPIVPVATASDVPPETREELLRRKLRGVRFSQKRQRIKQLRRDLTVAISELGKDGVYHLKARRQGLSGRQWVRLRKALTKEYRKRMKVKEENDRIGAFKQ